MAPVEERPVVDTEQKKKILIMDDEDMVGEIACQMLGFLGYASVWVTDGADAVRTYQENLAQGEKFAAVIMDLTIPGGMGGREAVAELLAIDHSAKVYVSSGYSTDPIMVNYHDYGFSGVIAKPFDLAAIQKLLDTLQ